MAQDFTHKITIFRNFWSTKNIVTHKNYIVITLPNPTRSNHAQLLHPITDKCMGNASNVGIASCMSLMAAVNSSVLDHSVLIFSQTLHTPFFAFIHQFIDSD